MTPSNGSPLGARRRAIALAFSETLFPAGDVIPAAGEDTLRRAVEVLESFGPGAADGWGALFDVYDWSTVLSCGSRFSKLSPEKRLEVLRRDVTASAPRRGLLFALGMVIKNVHLADPEVYRSFGCVYDKSAPAEPARWMQQVMSASDLDEAYGAEDVECDVVVVGTGAGGAVMAKELAEAGHAVVLVEEGSFHTRADFTGRGIDAFRKLYRNGGAVVSVGNTIIPIPIGRTVGGTTAVNSGTCFRTPDRVLARWRDELGLREFTPDHMAPYFEKVERELRIETAKAEYVGEIGQVIARGCDALGWSHHALARNAPDCDGQGVCVFGCPTDAKRSTNVSYVPMALERAALLVTGFRADRVLTENGKAVGISGRVAGTDRSRTIRARAVVLSCGTLVTPTLLERQKLIRNEHLGRNLTIHPAIAASAEVPDDVRGYASIPQGYCVDEFHDEGILMEGGSLPVESAPSLFDLVGPELTATVENYDRIAHLRGHGLREEGSGSGADDRRPHGRAVLGEPRGPRLPPRGDGPDRRHLLRGRREAGLPGHERGRRAADARRPRSLPGAALPGGRLHDHRLPSAGDLPHGPRSRRAAWSTPSTGSTASPASTSVTAAPSPPRPP